MVETDNHCEAPCGWQGLSGKRQNHVEVWNPGLQVNVADGLEAVTRVEFLQVGLGLDVNLDGVGKLGLHGGDGLVDQLLSSTIAPGGRRHDDPANPNVVVFGNQPGVGDEVSGFVGAEKVHGGQVGFIDFLVVTGLFDHEDSRSQVVKGPEFVGGELVKALSLIMDHGKTS